MIFDCIESKDSADLRDIEGAIQQRDSVGAIQTAGDRDDFIDPAIVVPIGQGVDLTLSTSRDEQGPCGSQRKRARSRNGT
jgi:hypothetical protein